MSNGTQPSPAPPHSVSGIEEQHRLLTEALTDTALVLLDAEGRVADWNAGPSVSSATPPGKSWAGLLPSSSRPRTPARGLPGAQLRAAFEGQSSGVHWYVRKDGTRRWCSGNLKVLRAAGGTRARFRPGAAQTRRPAGRARKARRPVSAFQLATAAVAGLIYDADLLTGEVFRSEQLFALVGYHPDEAEPTVAWWVERIHPEDRARLLPAGQLIQRGSGPKSARM